LVSAVPAHLGESAFHISQIVSLFAQDVHDAGKVQQFGGEVHQPVEPVEVHLDNASSGAPFFACER